MTGRKARMWQDLRPLVVVNVIALFVMLSFASAPVFLGSYVDVLGFSLTQAGQVATAETLGLAVGSLLSSVLIARSGINLRGVVALCLLVLAAAQVGSALSTDVWSLIAFRGLSGLMAGLIYNAGNIYISGLAKPDRPYALYYGMLFVAGPLGLVTLPLVLPLIGLAGFFYVYGAALFLCIGLMAHYPKARGVQASDPDEADITAPTDGVRVLPMGLLLMAIVLNYICNGGIWVYAERIGMATGLAAEALGLLLSIAMLSGLLGSAFVTVVGDRFGRLLPVCVAHLMLVGSMVWFYSEPDATGFFCAVSLLNIAITLMTPYLLAFLAKVDDTGRGVVLGNVGISIGYGVGPGAISLLLVGDDFRQAFLWSMVGFALCLLLVFLAFRSLKSAAVDEADAAPAQG